jgi:hypothetical protein
MINKTRFITAALALTGVLAAGAAHAQRHDDVQWSVTIGSQFGTPVYSQPAPVIVQPAPVYRQYGQYGQYSQYGHTSYQQPSRWDRDGDGIPNRSDRLYNPAWDRDGDGIANRYDRVDNRRNDRDRDGVPDYRDRRDDRGGYRRY